MFSKLRVPHKLLLIYLLSLTSVIFLAARLISAENKEIDFAAKEIQGNAYIAPVRDAMTAVIGQWNRSMDLVAGLPIETMDRTKPDFQAVAKAEDAYGTGMDTKGLMDEVLSALRQVPATPQTADAQMPSVQISDAPSSVAEPYRTALAALRRLLARIGDQSNLILDPDLDSYYTMSLVVVDIPEIQEAIAELTAAAQRLGAGGDRSAGAQAEFLRTEGRVLAAQAKLEADIDTAYRSNASGSLSRQLEPVRRASTVAVTTLIGELKSIAQLDPSDKAAPQHLGQLRQLALIRVDELWRVAGSSLDDLLQQRVAALNHHLLTNLLTAAAISLITLLLILYIARQISGPIWQLARMAQSVQLTRNYQLRAKTTCGGEIGVLVHGFNAMLDRLLAESAGEQERLARESAALAQLEMLETVPVWLVIMRLADQEILYANQPTAISVAGGRVPELAVEPGSIIDRLDAQGRARLFQRLASQGVVDHLEAVLELAPQQHIWVLINARPLLYGDEASTLIVFTPINDLKLAEHERERSAQRLVDAIEAMSDGFALYNDADQLVLCNQRYREISPTTADFMKPGLTWLDMVTGALKRGEYPDAVGRENAWLASRVEHRRHPGTPLEIRLNSGQWLRAVDRRTREGGLVSILADITQQKLNERELRISEAFKTAVIDSALDSIVSVDEAGAILEFNPAAERTFGWRREDVLGRQMRDLIVPTYQGHGETGFADYIDAGATRLIGRRVETEAKDASGRIFPVELAIGDVALEGRRAFTVYLRDITGRRSAEAELARRASMLEAIGATATRIVVGVNWRHEIRELLGRLGVAAEVSRVTLFEAHSDDQGNLVQSCRFDWAEPGLMTLSEDPRYHNMPLGEENDPEGKDWLTRRLHGEVVRATRSETSGYTRQVFDEHGTLSFLSVPVMLGLQWWGFLGFDDCHVERNWSDVEIDVLKTAAALISGAIERSNAEERLRLSEQRYALAARGANDGLLDWDIRHDSAYFSPRLHEILGLADGALGTAPENLFKRVVGKDAIALRRGLQDRMTRRHRKFELECRMVHAAGGERWMLWRGIIVYNEDEAIRVVGSIHDIDNRKIAEARLRESEARFRALSDDAPVMLNLIDQSGKLTFANRRFLQFSDRELGEALNDGWIRDVHPDDVAGVLRGAGQAPGWPGVMDFEYRMRRQDGAYRWVHKTQVARYELDGAFAGFVASLVDVTDRRRAEAEVVRQREALHQNEKLTALGSLLAGVAHELNNPLSVVVGQAILLEEMAQQAEIISRAEIIRRAADRCARIVRTFLTLARHRQPEQGSVQLNAVIGMAIDLLGYQLRATDIDLRLDLASDLPELQADGDQLHQVVTNLIVNAQQALCEIPSHRRLAITTTLDSVRRSVRLTVADSGPGIAADISSRIFEPFFTTKPIGQGTGIGLSMCLNVVNAHKGSITVEGTPGGGATFIVDLPLATGMAARATSPVVDIGTVDRSVGHCRILVVDDETEISEILQKMLTNMGHDVEIARDGRSALDYLASGSYQVILSDLRMPVLDGPGLYAALERDYPAMLPRIAFITGDTLSARNDEFLMRTGAICLEKPFTPDDVRQLIARVIAAAG